MENLTEEMMINIKSSSCEEKEFTTIRLLPNSLKKVNLEIPRLESKHRSCFLRHNAEIE